MFNVKAGIVIMNWGYASKNLRKKLLKKTVTIAICFTIRMSILFLGTHQIDALAPFAIVTLNVNQEFAILKNKNVFLL
jgi:hypothetical protein